MRLPLAALSFLLALLAVACGGQTTDDPGHTSPFPGSQGGAGGSATAGSAGSSALGGSPQAGGAAGGLVLAGAAGSSLAGHPSGGVAQGGAGQAGSPAAGSPGGSAGLAGFVAGGFAGQGASAAAGEAGQGGAQAAGGQAGLGGQAGQGGQAGASPLDLAFSLADTLAALPWAYSVLTADLNDDGLPDLIALGAMPGLVSVFLGQGNCSFAPPTAFPLYGGKDIDSPGSAVVLDWDGDGHLDILVVGGNHAPSVSVLRGDGAGAFVLAPSLPAGSARPSDLVAADFNHDGHPDLALANDFAWSALVLLGDGQGGVLSSTEYPIWPGGIEMWGPAGIASADLNGDGFADLITADYFPGTTSVLLNDTHGGFLPFVFYENDVGFSSVVVTADLDRNGTPDAIVSGNGSAFDVSLSDSQGAFSSYKKYQDTSSSSSFVGRPAVVDLDKDGMLDVVTSGLGVFRGQGDGSFHEPISFRGLLPLLVPMEFPIAVVALDCNGDGLPDLATTTASATSTDGSLYVLANTSH